MDFVDHSSHPAAFTQTDTAVSTPPSDASETATTTEVQNLEDSLKDISLSSPASDYSDQRSNTDADTDTAISPTHPDARRETPLTELQHLEDALRDRSLSSPASEYSDQRSNADTSSRRSSTAYYEQEPFETYQQKVARLCRDIGYGEPSKIDRMMGGGYNRVIGLTLEAGQQRDYVLRIPREALDADEIHNIKDQVAATLYLSQYSFLHVPVIVAFDTTVNNVLECQYVLQGRIEGGSVQDIYYTLPLAEKLQITTAVAEVLLQLESLTLEKPGRLVGTGNLPDRSDIAPTSVNEIKIAGFRECPIEDLLSMEKQPLVSLIISLLEIRKQKNLEWDEMVERCERLQAIAREMEAAGMLRSTDEECGLWHWDLSASNVMIHQVITTQRSDVAEYSVSDKVSHKCTQDGGMSADSVIIVKQQINPAFSLTDGALTKKWVVSGILDWDDVMSVPLVLARKPPFWLWINEDTHGSIHEGNGEINPHVGLTQDDLLIKAHFDQIMARGSPSYIDDAYHRGPFIRALATFAIYNFEQGVYWDQYDDFVKSWEEFLETLALQMMEE